MSNTTNGAINTTMETIRAAARSLPPEAFDNYLEVVDGELAKYETESDRKLDQLLKEVAGMESEVVSIQTANSLRKATKN